MAESNILTPGESFPTQIANFKQDSRIHYDLELSAYVLIDQRSNEWEWREAQSEWVPSVDKTSEERWLDNFRNPDQEQDEHADDAKAQVAARKRKAQIDIAEEAKAKKQKAEPTPRRNTAIYVTSLPADVTVDEVYERFARFGMIAESAEDNTPRIKLYTDENGKFKGDALIVYFKPEAADNAVLIADEDNFRPGEKVDTGPMRVTKADSSFKAQKESTLNTAQAKTKGTAANRDRQKLIKKNEEMNSRLADWDDDEPQVIKKALSRWDKIVVLKHMFTLEEIAEDRLAISDIKNDIREECEKFGNVTNVILYDKEADGVVTVRYSDPDFAAMAAKKFNGRKFDGRKVEAYIADPKEKFKKSKDQDEKDEEEKARLEDFSRFIEGEDA